MQQHDTKAITRRRLIGGIAVAAVGGGLIGCGGGGSSASAVAPSVERSVSPTEIDPRVTTATEDHIVINPDPTMAPAGRLFVFLPGTDGTPTMYRKILRVGAARGYHAIGLNYPNPVPVGLLCRNSLDAGCYWDVRREIIAGNDLTDRVDIDLPNAIDTRLTMALSYLSTQFPTEGWGQFLDGGTPVWSRIVMAGHSQGGGHAAIIAKLRRLARAVYFAAPADWQAVSDAPAEWLSRTPQTPAGSQYGFTHLEDPLVPYDELRRVWSALGLDAFGAPTSVDGQAAPYGNRHMLTTLAEPGRGLAASPQHGAPVLDAVTPDGSDGQPLFGPVWAHLCFP